MALIVESIFVEADRLLFIENDEERAYDLYTQIITQEPLNTQSLTSAALCKQLSK